jgi:hypothetical protein
MTPNSDTWATYLYNQWHHTGKFDELDADIHSDDGSTTTNQQRNIHANTRLQLMVTPDESEKKDAAQTILKKVNDVIKTMVNKIPSCRIAPWTMEVDSLETDALIESFLDDADRDTMMAQAEKSLYGFSRHVSPNARGYFRINIFHDDTVTKSEFEEVAKLVQIRKEQSLQVAYSNATAPIQAGFFVGSTESMASSSNVKATFKELFSLGDFGLYWSYPQSQNKNEKFDHTRFAMHLEIDTTDAERLKYITDYFSPSGQKKTLFGTRLLFAPKFKFDWKPKQKKENDKFIKIHSGVNKTMQEDTLSEVSIHNTINDAGVTLHQALMEVDSITKKIVLKDGKESTFYGKLFYAIIPDREDKSCTFYFSPANDIEASSVISALPLFVEGEFKVKATTFFRSELIVQAKNGDYDHAKRLFVSQDQKDQNIYISNLESVAKATVPEYLSDNHRRAFTNDENASQNTLNTKNTNKNPLALNTGDDISGISGSTGKTSKSKVDSAVKTVAKQMTNAHAKIMQEKNTEMEALVEKIAQLQKEANRSTEKKSNSDRRQWLDHDDDDEDEDETKREHKEEEEEEEDEEEKEEEDDEDNSIDGVEKEVETEELNDEEEEDEEMEDSVDAILDSPFKQRSLSKALKSVATRSEEIELDDSDDSSKLDPSYTIVPSPARVRKIRQNSLGLIAKLAGAPANDSAKRRKTPITKPKPKAKPKPKDKIKRTKEERAADKLAYQQKRLALKASKEKQRASPRNHGSTVIETSPAQPHAAGGGHD